MNYQALEDPEETPVLSSAYSAKGTHTLCYKILQETTKPQVQSEMIPGGAAAGGREGGINRAGREDSQEGDTVQSKMSLHVNQELCVVMLWQCSWTTPLGRLTLGKALHAPGRNLWEISTLFSQFPVNLKLLSTKQNLQKRKAESKAPSITPF